MRITNIDVMVVGRGGRPPKTADDIVEEGSRLHFEAPSDIVVVVVRTDEGIEGYGFGWGIKGGRRLAEEIAAVFKPELLGEDPLDRERLWHKAMKADRWGGHTPFTAYGPLDVALWDITAKKAGLPLYKLLGGYRTKVLAYASSPVFGTPEEYANQAVEAKAKGYRAYKLHPPGDPDLDIECCRAVRRAVGDDMILMSDPVAAYDHEQALRVGRALERLNFYWLEEPLHDYDVHGYVELCRAARQSST